MEHLDLKKEAEANRRAEAMEDLSIFFGAWSGVRSCQKNRKVFLNLIVIAINFGEIFYFLLP